MNQMFCIYWETQNASLLWWSQTCDGWSGNICCWDTFFPWSCLGSPSPPCVLSWASAPQTVPDPILPCVTADPSPGSRVTQPSAGQILPPSLFVPDLAYTQMCSTVVFCFIYLFGVRKSTNGKTAAVTSYLTCPFPCGLAAAPACRSRAQRPPGSPSGICSAFSWSRIQAFTVRNRGLLEMLACSNVLNGSQSKYWKMQNTLEKLPAFGT